MNCREVGADPVQSVLALLVLEQVHQRALVVVLAGKLVQVAATEHLGRFSLDTLAHQIFVGLVQRTET